MMGMSAAGGLHGEAMLEVPRPKRARKLTEKAAAMGGEGWRAGGWQAGRGSKPQEVAEANPAGKVWSPFISLRGGGGYVASAGTILPGRLLMKYHASAAELIASSSDL